LDLGVLIADDAAVYVDVNKAACELFGRRPSEIVGHHLSEFIEGARVHEVDVQWKAFLRDGSQAGVFSIQLPNGSSRAFNFQARANFVEGLHCSFVTASPDLQQVPDAQSRVTMCAWTRRVRVGDKWLDIEHYLKLVHGLDVSHGISPDAFAAFGSR
jgi:PAS domain-containing protein